MVWIVLTNALRLGEGAWIGAFTGRKMEELERSQMLGGYE